MPGFLSGYEGVERIDLGDGYWIDVKKCLSHAELQRAQAKMGACRQQVQTDGRGFATLDMNAFETELIIVSIADWNLDDENGVKWPLEPEPALRAAVNRLPAPVSSQVFKRCNELNGPEDRKTQARFPDRTRRGGKTRDDGPAAADVVQGQESLLAATGGDSTDDGSTALA